MPSLKENSLKPASNDTLKSYNILTLSLPRVREGKILNLILQNCQKQTATLESTAQ